ncbi:MAG: hypothetical protein K9J13_06580 [Saprospiraceae bacterium]|nr:hypothetical protein [Saprospiraceae bacterium]
MSTVIGTISHEYGYILFAKYVGYKTELHYASMNYNREKRLNEYFSIAEKYQYQIENNLPFTDKTEFDKTGKLDFKIL